ncbi:MAG: (d)CMP kinase [Thermoplasmata archaeon]
MKLTVSGPPGSGKTTVSKLVAKKLSYLYISGGDVFRKLANDHNMSIEQFSKYSENNQEIDRKIDSYLKKELENNDNIILDSRLAGWLAYLNNIKAIKIYVTASFETRVKRISGRETSPEEEISKNLAVREESEKYRYLLIYNIHYEDLKIYDLIIDSDDKDPETVANIIMEYVNANGY